jgi:hypothetical protein
MKEIDEHQKQLKEFLDTYKNLTDIYPYVRQAYDLATFKKEVADTIPADLGKEYTLKLTNSLTDGIDYYKTNLPAITIGPSFSATSGLTMSISGATGSISILSEIEDFCDTKYNSWTSDLIGKYVTIQNTQERKTYILNILNTISNKVASEFELAIGSYEKYIGSSTNQNDCGINCRNVLEHLKGELFDKALTQAKITTPTKQKIKDFLEMSDYIAIGGIGSAEHRQLQTEAIINATIWTDFTNVAKNRNPETLTSMQAKFSAFIDHLYNTLTLIDKAKL